MVADAIGHDAVCLRNGHDGTIPGAEQHHGPAMDDPLVGAAVELAVRRSALGAERKDMTLLTEFRSPP